MNAGAIASKNVVCIKPGASILEATKLMAQQNIGFLILSSDCKKDLAGVISERDIIRAIANGLQPSEPVDTIATRKVVYVYKDTPVWEVARLMRKYNIRHIVVMDDGQIFGVISIRDLLRESDFIERLVEYAEERIDELSAHD